MHIVKFLHGVPGQAVNGIQKFYAQGEEVLCEDVQAGVWLSSRGISIKCEDGITRPLAKCVEAKPWTRCDKLDPSKDYSGKRLLFIRPGGFGDALFLTPIYREIKLRWPKAIIHACPFHSRAEILFNNPDIDEIVSYPVTLAQANTYDAVISMELLVEFNHDANNKHIVDLHAEAIGIEPTVKQCIYIVTEREKEMARRQLHLPPKSVAIQLSASSPVRTWPVEHVQTLSRMLIDNGFSVYWLGSPGQCEAKNTKNFKNVTMLPFREQAAVVEMADITVAPDSVFAHIAGALGKPCIALYGSFAAKYRTLYHRSVIPIQAGATCAPCFFHNVEPNEWPEHGPCKKHNECVVMRMIPPELVYEKIVEVLK